MSNLPSAVCCPEFTPSRFDKKTHVWKDKLFLKDQVRQIMHIPLNMGTVITRMYQKLEAAQATPDTAEFLMLCYDPSPWLSEIYLTATKPVPNGIMATLSGTFISKVYDGPYNAVPNWIKDMNAYLASTGKKALKYYFYYAYCPRCAKKYGHNYCVAFAQVK